jgi:membrane protease subunit HflK
MVIHVKSDPPRASSVVIPVLILIVVVGWCMTGFYQIGTGDVGVVTRFGRYNATVPSGLKFCLPFGIDRVQKVPASRQMKEEFGYRTLQAGVRSSYDPNGFPKESLMVTGDLNAADVEWSVQYRITDPKAYLFNVRDVTDTLRAAAESVMREVVGDRAIDEVLTVGRANIEQEAETRLQDLMNRYEMGIQIEQLVLQDVNPPQEVKDSFNQVNQAQQAKERLINEARSEYNKVVPRAKGEAEQQIQQAQGYAIERANQARGDVARFDSLLAAWRLAPAITSQRMYLETMQGVLPAIGRKVLIDAEARSVLPLLQLGDDAESTTPSRRSK